MPRRQGRTPKHIRQAKVVVAFGQRLRQLRLERGLSQMELARAAGAHWTYIGRLERGRAAPGLDLLDRLADALKVGLSDIFPSSPVDPLPELRAQAQKRFTSILSRGDAATFALLVPILAMFDAPNSQ
jgi:transcriptional regulator with XRE-family HTH domain